MLDLGFIALDIQLHGLHVHHRNDVVLNIHQKQVVKTYLVYLRGIIQKEVLNILQVSFFIYKPGELINLFMGGSTVKFSIKSFIVLELYNEMP
uniref:Uncharacterized protein n=1 Tax=Lactuca sativa TaxID=4236 RepID=A0A9R1W2Y2_LACSA|nr:hypothetical protein LSAT_V11C300104910 [Lactuca sativa]